ncbi:MAG: calcium/sodium antiporter [Desulfovibrionales bacterium]|nr:calcium/sodium antiporter [Desulfovibrionales bacterium]
MTLAVLALVVALVLLVWSADRFVDGSAAMARYLGMSPLLIGMVIVGFGTSAPEMFVSALAALQNNPGIALGNAYGSNITNIALILGLTALLRPIVVHSQVVRTELPVLAGVTALAAWQMWNNAISRADALLMLLVFACIMVWTIWRGQRSAKDELVDLELCAQSMSLRTALLWIVCGLVLLVGSSRLLVWAAVTIAHGLGMSDLIIGLTVVAVGTSLPELASSLAAIRKNEHDIALGNVLGSNLFNTLVVVGIAGSIQPLTVGPEVFRRDIMVMSGLTLALFVFSYSSRGEARITRLNGLLLLAAYLAYTTYLVQSTFLA